MNGYKFILLRFTSWFIFTLNADTYKWFTINAETYKLVYHLIQNEEEDEQFKVAGGTYTTAEPRPNAYIPDDDTELPIPRPYGSNAPFKPSETGSTMRHIRKPVPKPIEI